MTSQNSKMTSHIWQCPLSRLEHKIYAENSENYVVYEYIPLSNRVRGPHWKLRTEFFSRSICGPNAKRPGHKSKGKKRGSVADSTDQEKEVSKIFILLYCVSGGLKNDFCSRWTAFNSWSTSKAKRVNLNAFYTQYRIKDSFNKVLNFYLL